MFWAPVFGLELLTGYFVAFWPFGATPWDKIDFYSRKKGRGEGKETLAHNTFATETSGAECTTSGNGVLFGQEK
jgi:hypothetical protein